MYILGLMGATRRLDHYDASTGWQPFFIMMLVGGLIIAVGTALQIAQITASLIQKNRLRDTTGDPWGGRTLEWATSSPPAYYNFTTIPTITSRDALLDIKAEGDTKVEYEDIMIPKNTAAGIYISAFAFLAGFGFVWYIWWLVIVSIIGIIAVFIVRGFNEESEYVLSAKDVEKYEIKQQKQAAKNLALNQQNDEEEMGLWDFIRYIWSFAMDIIKMKRWRKW
jgi:cytochrome o ubiquinol oxidase subunit 1